jgi:thymidylate synthase (FAD)
MVRIVQQSYEVVDFPWAGDASVLIEQAGRTCYKSEDKITDESAPAFAKMLLDRGHEAMIEFGRDPVVRLVCNRGISHELVRHRLASYAQESTRYCDYTKDKHGNRITVIDMRPWLPNDEAKGLWVECMHDAQDSYFAMRDYVPAQIARGVLPIDLKTEVVTKMNPRQWRHFFKMRAAKPAHPQMRALASSILIYFRKEAPGLFDDVGSTEWAMGPSIDVGDRA